MIIRTKKSNNYTLVPNDLINDKRLDWRDLGIITYLLSKPSDWQVKVKQLASERKAGRDAIYKMIDVLIDAGYCEKRNLHTGGVEYVIRDYPLPENTEPVEKEPFTGKPETVEDTPLTENTEADGNSPLTENQEAVDGQPLPEKPLPENPFPENTEAYKELSNTNKQKGVPPPQIEGLNIHAWEQWIDFRKEAGFKKYKTDQAARALAKIPHEQQQRCVEYSMRNEYQGLFPERFENAAHQRNTQKTDIVNDTNWATSPPSY